MRSEYFYHFITLTSIILVTWQHLGMNKRLEIYPQLAGTLTSLNDNINGGTSIGQVSDNSTLIELDCQTRKSPYTFAFCGFNIAFDSQPGSQSKGIDLSNYQSLDIWLSLETETKDTVLIYLKNSEQDRHGQEIKRSNLRALYPASEMSHYSLQLSSFSVPSWWLFANADKVQGNSAPRLDNVTDLQVSTGDNAFDRSETIRIQRIELNGKWIGKNELYGALLMVWGFAVLFHLGTGLVALRNKLTYSDLKTLELERLNRFISVEKDKYKTMAKVDPLTKAYNRAGINEMVKQSIKHYQNTASPCSMIMIDIDHFKSVNDNFGHDAGDRILVTLVELIKNNSRKNDFLARWGGEEFVLICPGTPGEMAKGIAEKLRAIIAGSSRFEPAITCSFGVCELNSSNIKAWFKSADDALYRAKQSGRNCISTCWEAVTTPPPDKG